MTTASQEAVRLTWRETIRLLRSDRAVFIKTHTFETGTPPRFPLLHPAFQCVFFYRLARLSFTNGHRIFARFFWHIGLFLTGADIAPMSNIGAGLSVLHPAGCIFAAAAGENLTLYGFCGVGGGRQGHEKDIGAGSGLPVLGNDVEVHFGVAILGPLRIGDRVQIGPRVFVSKDVPSDTSLFVEATVPPPARRRSLNTSEATQSASSNG